MPFEIKYYLALLFHWRYKKKITGFPNDITNLLPFILITKVNSVLFILSMGNYNNVHMSRQKETLIKLVSKGFSFNTLVHGSHGKIVYSKEGS